MQLKTVCWTTEQQCYPSNNVGTLLQQRSPAISLKRSCLQDVNPFQRFPGAAENAWLWSQEFDTKFTRGKSGLRIYAHFQCSTSSVETMDTTLADKLLRDAITAHRGVPVQLPWLRIEANLRRQCAYAWRHAFLLSATLFDPPSMHLSAAKRISFLVGNSHCGKTALSL